MAKSSSICRESITLGDNALAQTLYGQNNVHLKLIERQLGLSLHARGNELTMIGTADAVERAHRLMQELTALHRTGTTISSEEVVRALVMLQHAKGSPVRDVLQDAVVIAQRARPVVPKSVAQ